jgi:hypothetical protein
MKRSSIIALTLVFSVFGIVRSGAAQFGRNDRSGGSDRVCLYQDANYRGWEECYRVGDEVTSLNSGHNSQASSIRVYGRARAIVYAQGGFKGASTEFSSDVPELQLRAAPEGHTWNDRIMSIRVVSDFDSRDTRNDRNDRPGGAVSLPPAQNPPSRGVNEGICFYERANYQGREECLRSGDEVSDISRRGLGDRISSVRVFGGARAVFYRSSNFRGERLIVDRDIPDLSRVRMEGTLRTWNDQISSVQVEDERGRGRGRGRGRDR